MADNEPHGSGMTADEAIQRLVEGNERFLRGKTLFSTIQKEILVEDHYD
jgi:hypothetical protein